MKKIQKCNTLALCLKHWGGIVYNHSNRHFNAIEVLFERKVEVKSRKKEKHGIKAVDYSFRLGGTDKFFVEAKKTQCGH